MDNIRRNTVYNLFIFTPQIVQVPQAARPAPAPTAAASPDPSSASGVVEADFTEE